MAKLTKAEQQRRLGLISTLAALSRDGWLASQPVDYQPLERELRELDAKMDRDARRTRQVSQYVVTIRETTDHQIVIDAASPTQARLKAERIWLVNTDGDFDMQIGPRQVFVRAATRPSDEKLPHA